MKLTSNDFKHGMKIPKKFGYKFENINPSLIIDDVPKNTKSLVLIMDDPDAMAAVGKVWSHWILWNISPKTQKIEFDSVPTESKVGINDFGEKGYGGPAPPDKEHTYFFKLYAISKSLDLPEDTTKSQIEDTIKSSILAETNLQGKFSP